MGQTCGCTMWVDNERAADHARKRHHRDGKPGVFTVATGSMTVCLPEAVAVHLLDTEADYWWRTVFDPVKGTWSVSNRESTESKHYILANFKETFTFMPMGEGTVMESMEPSLRSLRFYQFPKKLLALVPPPPSKDLLYEQEEEDENRARYFLGLVARPPAPKARVTSHVRHLKEEALATWRPTVIFGPDDVPAGLTDRILPITFMCFLNSKKSHGAMVYIGTPNDFRVVWIWVFPAVPKGSIFGTSKHMASPPEQSFVIRVRGEAAPRDYHLKSDTESSMRLTDRLPRPHL